MKFWKEVLAIILTFTGLSLKAQDTFSIKKAVDVSLERNYNLDSKEKIVKKSKNNEKKYFRNNYLLDFNASYNSAFVWNDNSSGDLNHSLTLFTGTTLLDFSRKPKLDQKKNYTEKQIFYLNSSQITLVRDVILGYFNILKSDNNLEIYNSWEKEIDSIINVRKENVDSLTFVKDYMNLKPLLEKIASKKEDITSEKNLQVSYLNKLMSRNYDEEIYLEDKLENPDLFFIGGQEFLDSLITKSIEIHTYIDSLNKRDKELDIRIAKVAYFPKASTSGGYKQDFETGYEGLSIGFGVTLPIWDNGVSKIKIDNAEIDMGIIDNQIESKKLEIRQWVINDYENIIKFNNRVQKNNLESSKNLYTLTLNLYMGGDATVQEFKTVQEGYYNSLINHNNNIKLLNEYIVRLCHTLQDFSYFKPELINN